MATAQGDVPVLCLLVSAAMGLLAAPQAWGADWDQVKKLKRGYLALAARHAIEQQRTDQAPAMTIAFPGDVTAHGGVELAGRSPRELSLRMTVQPSAYRKPTTEFVRMTLPRPVDMVSKHSGLAFTVRAAAGTSPEVRLGCRLTDGRAAVEITPIVPALSRWGDETHEVYLDWAFLNYADAEQAVEVLKSVKTVELTAAAIRRAPQRGGSPEARPATITISDLRLVDYLKGSYDPSRRWLTFDDARGAWVPGGRKDMTLQHRCQEVTGIVALFGGDAGIRSAVDSLDMAARTQCWDGSFLDGRRGAVTVASGEYTFGFTLYGLLCGYEALEKGRSPLLAEKVTLGPATMTRRDAYQRMFYRGAMSRAGIAVPETYRDDIIGGNTLITGANRVLGYAIAMRMIADALTDKARSKRVLAAYRPLMEAIADAQGKFSGGFPVLGEGNRFRGKGIHYDASYTRTHMDWLVLGVRRTGDPLLVRMLQRYQTVFEAAMDSHGTGILPMISERRQGTRPVQLILPDATAQVGMKYHLPIIAQWGYNCGIPVWTHWERRPGNHFTFASHTRGYSLGAHTSILVDDMAAEPTPKDLGYLFPRQFPIWSSRLYNKAGQLQRTSRVTIHADGTMSNDYRIEVGEYPVTVGVPVTISVTGGTVAATADKLTGWPKLLPEDAVLEVRIDTWDRPRQVKVGGAFSLVLDNKAKIVITGPQVTLPEEAGGSKVPFRAELTLQNASHTAATPDPRVVVTVLRGTVPYTHTFTADKAP